MKPTKPNKCQLRALLAVYNRGPISGLHGDKPMSYREFRRSARYICHMNVLMVQWCNMWLGIEPDGYTHS